MRVDIMVTSNGDVVVVHEAQVALIPGSECVALSKILGRWNSHTPIVRTTQGTGKHSKAAHTVNYRRDEEVLHTMRLMKAPMTSHDVFEQYMHVGTDVSSGSVSSALHRLHLEGKIERIGGTGTPGNGYQYKVKDQGTKTDEPE